MNAQPHTFPPAERSRSAPAAPPRILPWRDEHDDRSSTQRALRSGATLGLTALLSAGATSLLLQPFGGPSNAIAGNASGQGPSSPIRILRDASTVAVDAVYQYRLFAEPEIPWQGPPADGAPTTGFLRYREAGKAWRIEEKVDPERAKYFASMDQSFSVAADGTGEYRYHDVGLGHAAIASEEPPLIACWSMQPFYWLAWWAAPLGAGTSYPLTRSTILGLSDEAISIADDGWSLIELDGADGVSLAEQVTILSGGDGSVFVLTAPPGERDELISIDHYAADGAILRRVRFNDWKVPAWGETSAFEPRTLPYTVTVIGYDKLGATLYEATLSIVACAIDLPLPADELTASFDGATTIVDTTSGNWPQ